MLWIDASSEISAHQAIKNILSKAEIPTSALEFERNLLAFKDALTPLKGPCLLVFDNYDTPKNFSKIADMFVYHEQVCIMLTSRHHESLRLGTPIHVRDMDQNDAEDLLLTSSGLIRQDVNPNHLPKIVNTLGRLPLALDQAGAYIGKLHLSLDVFEKHYIDKRKKILQYTPDLFEYRKSLSPSAEPSVLSVFTTWELSLEQLGDDRPHLEHLLTLSAFFDHRIVYEALFSTRCTLNFTACSGVQDCWLQCMLTDSTWDSYRFQDIIANMYGLSLLQKFWIEGGHIFYSLHPLVSDWLRTRVGEKERASMIVEAAVTVLGTVGSLSLTSHLAKCLLDLQKCEHTSSFDCVDMRPPQIIAKGVPVAKSVADGLKPEPHYLQARALSCPHGRPYPIISSTIRLKLMLTWRMAGIISPQIQKESQRSQSIHVVAKSVDIARMFPTLVRVLERFALSAPDFHPLYQRLHKLLEEFVDQSTNYETLFLEYDTLSQDILTLCQKTGTLSESNIDYKDAEVKVKQEEENGVDGSFHTHLTEALAASTSLLEVLVTFDRPDNLAQVRDQLRSLPFLQSGS